MTLRASCVERRGGALSCTLPMLLALALSGHSASSVAAPPAAFGTYLRPFSAESPWNARPVQPELATDTIPKSSYFPAMVEGAWSTGVFLASPEDKPVTVLGRLGRPGLWDADAESPRQSIVIPRWPADVTPAAGSDGHADIVDPVTGIVHSFWQLRFAEGEWRAEQYAWTRIDGRGWGEPGHYYQGARAAAVPTMGGVIRKSEIEDGQPLFHHALAMSLTFNGLSPKPAYVFPATAADAGAEKSNTGTIPEGALLMLPPDYDTTRIQNADLRKAAETLKVYGGYVVDRNTGTPYVIYVENGSHLNLHKGGWNNAVAAELDRIRASLRPVVKVKGWLDGNGQPMQMERRLNLLSMRGPWRLVQGNAPAGRFDTWQQAVVFPPGSQGVVMGNGNGNNLHPVTWARPQPGALYRLKAYATGGASMRLELYDRSFQKRLFSSGNLGDGKSVEFRWPDGQGAADVFANSGRDDAGSSVGAELVAVDEPPVVSDSNGHADDGH